MRISFASSAASGACSGLITSCVIPVRSRRSTKTRPPWSRRRAAQPDERLARADVLLAELAAHDVPPGHADSLPTISARASGSSACPGRRSTALSRADDDGRRGAEARRLGQLALQRAPGVVGVDGDARAARARRAAAPPRSAARPRRARRRRRSSGGGRGDACFLHRDDQPLEAGAEADARGRRPADLLDEAVVAAAARDGRVLVLHRADELPGRARVVVEAAHERRHERVGDAGRVEVGPDGGEVRDARLAERLADLRCLVERCPDRLGLGEVVVEDAQRARRDLGARVGVEAVLVLLEPGARASRGRPGGTRGSRSS